MKKTVISFILAALTLLGSFPGFAQSAGYDIDLTGDSAVIEGTAISQAAGKEVSLLVCKGSVFSPDDAANIVWFDQTKTGEGGAFSFPISLDSSLSYTAQVKVEGEVYPRVYTLRGRISLSDSFEDYSGGASPHWYQYSNPATKYTAVNLDEAHGTSLGMKAVANKGSAFAIYDFGRILPADGVYKLSFDIRSDNPTPLFYIRLLKDGWTAINNANTAYMTETFCATKGNLGYYRGSAGWTQKTLCTWTADQWYSVDLWLDAANETATYTIRNDSLGIYAMGETDFVSGLGLKGFALVQEGTENNLYLDHLSFTAMDWESIHQLSEDGVIVPEKLQAVVACSVSSEKVGNIFFDAEPVSLNLKLKNRSDSLRQADLNLTVTDLGGTVVWSGVQSTTLGIGQEKNIKIPVELPRYGAYLFRAEDAQRGYHCNAQLSRSIRSDKVNEKIGICAHFDRPGGDVETNMDLAEAAGFGYVRTDWPRAETSPGVYSNYYETDPRFSVYIRESMDKKIGMLGLTGFNSSLYPDSDGGYYTSDEALAALENYLRWLADHLKGKVTYFEIGNEVNYIKNSDGTQAPAADYVKILKAAYRGIKAGNPDAKVVAFASALAYAADRQYMRDALNVMRDEGTYYFDAISVHPYHIAQAPEVKDRWIENTTWLQQSAYLQAMLTEYGIPEKEKWATETGYYTTTANVYAEQDKETMASYYVRMMALNEAYGFYDKLFFYDLQNDGTDPSYSEHNFGVVETWKMVDSPFAAKPAYLATANWNRMMTGAAFEQITVSGTVYQCVFRQNGQKITLVWDVANQASPVTVAAGTALAVAYDMYGNQLSQVKDGSGVTVQAKEQPVYVVSSDYTMTASSGGREITSLAGLPQGEEITFRAAVKNGGASLFLIAEYADRMLTGIQKAQTDATGEVEIKRTYQGVTDQYQMLLLDSLEHMRPLTNAVELR